MAEMEIIIIQQANMMETCGYHMNQWQNKFEPKNE